MLRLLVAAPLLVALLAGCAAAPDEGLLSAEDAIRAVLDQRPDGKLLMVSGTEGYLPPADRPTMALRDDGIADGRLGDGLLSSWVVGMADGGRYVETRVHGDGRAPLVRISELEGWQRDVQVFQARQPIDATEAVRAARSHAGFATSADGAAGHTYVYSLVRQAPAGSSVGELHPSKVGAFVEANAWALTHVGSDAATGQFVATTAQVDALEGHLLGLHCAGLAETRPVLEGPFTLEDETSPLIPTMHHLVFQVPPGASRLLGGLEVRPESLLAPDEVEVEVRQPNGEVVASTTGRWLPVLVEGDVEAGTWSVVVTSSLSTPQDKVQVRGSLHAVLPVTP